MPLGSWLLARTRTCSQPPSVYAPGGEAPKPTIRPPAGERETSLDGANQLVVVRYGIAPRIQWSLGVGYHLSPPGRRKNALASHIDVVNDRHGGVHVRGGKVNIAPHIDVVLPTQIERDLASPLHRKRGHIAVDESGETEMVVVAERDAVAYDSWEAGVTSKDPGPRWLPWLGTVWARQNPCGPAHAWTCCTRVSEARRRHRRE